MKSTSSNVKIYPSFKSMFITILISFFVIEIVIVCADLLIQYLTKGVVGLSILDIILLCVVFVSTVIFIIFTKYRAYYLLTPNGVVVQKYFKKTFYNYKDVIYIDDIRSKKDKRVYLYLVKGSEVTLTSDSKNNLLNQLILRCENLLSRVEFLKKFPNKNLNYSKKRKNNR